MSPTGVAGPILERGGAPRGLARLWRQADFGLPGGPGPDSVGEVARDAPAPPNPREGSRRTARNGTPGVARRHAGVWHGILRRGPVLFFPSPTVVFFRPRVGSSRGGKNTAEGRIKTHRGGTGPVLFFRPQMFFFRPRVGSPRDGKKHRGGIEKEAPRRDGKKGTEGQKNRKTAAARAGTKKSTRDEKKRGRLRDGRKNTRDENK